MFQPLAGQHRLLTVSLVSVICTALLVSLTIPISVSQAAPEQTAARTARPHPGKPEGVFPDLTEAKNDSEITREPEAPVPSTLRSPRNPLRPWDGKRVGDPGTRGEVGQSLKLRRRAHASRSAPPTVLDDQFVANFFSWALVRTASGTESTYWKDQLRVAYAQNQTSLKLAAIELGKTLFESAEYAARNRDNHWYVYDLYKTYLMRDPDASGWAHWESQVPSNGRENVRRAFEECSEFAGIVASVLPNGSATANAASLISARVNPKNQPGYGMLARDGAWSVPLLSLPGRAGLDLGLGLSYSSLVWTRNGPYIHFDEDNGFPSPGFRLGFPTVQRKVFDAQTARNSFLLITASGQRVGLRQVGSSNIYLAGDSSYLQLTDNGATLLVHSTDGTRLRFTEINNEWRCVEVKDRNGNYITVNHNALGHITTITDTLSRVITFNYDTNANLISITQSWNGQPAHQWVGFNWGTRNMQSSFSGAAVIGPKNGTLLPVITQVTLNDTSHVTFDYTNSLQVYLIRNYFGTLQRSETTFTYETPGSDVPRLTDSRISAHNWTGINGVPSQVITTYSVAGDGACVMTAPDGTIYKEYYGTGWQRGLTTLSEVWSGGVRQKWTTTAWTQDTTSVTYEVNPRITETNVYDAGGNRRRTVIEYGGYAPWGLPYAVKEYAANGTTEIRQTFIDYHLGQTYLDKRIIGLISEVHLTNVSQYQGKISYSYDEPSRLQSVPAAATQHDPDYSTSLTTRGNVTAVSRWDFTDINNAAKKLTTYTNYYTTGTPASSTDPSGHQSTVTYADSFSDGFNRSTFAYPTKITDADGFSSNIQYNFDFGATTRTQSPTPAGQTQGAIQTMTYNSLGQLARVTITNNGAYRRFWYGADFTASYATVNNLADEAYSIQVTDGVGRVIGAAANHPGSSGSYRLVNTIYDLMGRAWKRSNPAEVNNSWVPSGDDSAGIYYTQQTYDWQGRPLRTTHPDSTYREAAYSGCGCAGGEVMTLTDEGTIEGGVERRRQQKTYSDVLGRTVKTEVLNWSGGTVYSSTVNTYNVRDQLTEIKQYAGAAGSGTFQTTTMTYDGYGRLSSRHVPEQNSGAATVYTYHNDDTLSSFADARGATTSFTYNARHFVTSVSYSASSGIPIPSSISYQYDGAGNRTSMTDGAGSTNYQYNSLSQMTSETRTFTGLSGNYTLSYDYTVSGRLKSLTDHTTQRVNYGYDATGRVNSLTGTNYSSSQFINNYSYRAWGGVKQILYGNGRSQIISYNQRLQPTHLEIPAGQGFSIAMSFDYQYYNDGRLKFSANNRDHRFDRSYEYDHVGRLKKALSGAEARGEPATTNRPYKETATFDEFGHLKTRSTFHWSRTFAFGSLDTYVNNRRVGWSYDADGNWLSGNGRQHTYDAAGRNTTTSWTSGGSFNQFYDGDGQRVKTTESNVVTYYLRSSVLGGLVIEELDNGGVKQKGFIYEGGKLIGYQAANGNVILLHQDSSGRTIRSSSPSSPGVGPWSELDPWGAEVYGSDPYPENPSFSGGRGEGGPVFPGAGDISMPSTGCSVMLDGVLTLCDFADRHINGGGILVERLQRNGTRQLLPLSIVVGLKRVWHEPRSGNSSMDIDDSGPGDPVIRTNNSVPGFWETIVEFEPQKPPKKPVDWTVLDSVLRNCVRKLWQFFEVTDITWTSPAGEGGKPDDDSKNGVIHLTDTGLNTNFKIVNDPTPPPDVKALLMQTKSRGAVHSKNPFWTYAYPKAGPAARAGEKRYPELYGPMSMDYVRVQIHEAGAALTLIRDMYHPAMWMPFENKLDPDHPDDGPVLEDCVGENYYKQLGLTPKQ